MAQPIGIECGSPEFKQMKAGAKGHTDHLKPKIRSKKKRNGKRKRERKKREGQA